MYNAWVRHILMALAIGGAAAFILYRQYELASASGFLFLFILWSHFRHSSVLLASKYFKNGNLEKARTALAEVANPDRLSKNRRGYYEFMLANIALKEENFVAAEQHFQIASRFPLGGKNQKSYVLIHLANISVRNKDPERAATYVEKARELAVSSRANDLIARLDKEIERLRKEIIPLHERIEKI